MGVNHKLSTIPINSKYKSIQTLNYNLLPLLNSNLFVTQVKEDFLNLYAMSAKKLLFIVNPISGGRDKREILNAISKSFDPSPHSYDIVNSEYSGHSNLLACEAVNKGYDGVIAIGGDGTVNEVAAALIQKKTALGIIPCGSGNGLARHLNIPINYIGAIDIIKKGIVESFDYGLINNQPFFTTCGVGFDAEVSQTFANSDNRFFHSKRGIISYLENIIRNGINYQPKTYTIETESGEKRYKALLVACANASQYGNNAYIAPQASMKDGFLDVIIIEPFSFIDAPHIAIQLFTKTLNSNNHIKTFRTKKVTIYREEDGAAHRDGEPFITGKQIDIQIVEKGIKILVSPPTTLQV